jgi:hypothetical protein
VTRNNRFDHIPKHRKGHRVAELAAAAIVGAVIACAISTRAADQLREASSDQHWSFRPVVRPAVPTLGDPQLRSWARNEIDAFISDRLQRQGLRPAADSDRRTLIRRLTFDLTGLPPTPGEIADFMADPSDAAYEKLVDRLLASPRYGERWGQHWLDVIRFAESEGFEYDRHHSDAWRFRDYVIGSFNDDKPYDAFVREQLAGDEIAPHDRTAQIAVGFHRLGAVRRNAGNPEIAFSRNEVLTTRTDIVGSAFLGLSLACARCHDHKFDPIAQKEYYQMQAFFAASDEYDISLASDDERAEWKQRTDAAMADIKKIKESLKGSEGETKHRLEEQLEEAEDRLPPPLPAIFSVRNDMEKRSAIHVLRRGEDDKKAEPVAPRTLGALGGSPADLPADAANPRSVLADWITNSEHPLTARVMVNRVWQWHFGNGLVATSNDFGANGERPSHPELLDYLASEFARNQCRLKPIHRLICLSSTYRQSRRAPDVEQSLVQDPDNRLLGHFNVRRLEAEEVRDAMLAAAGKLNHEFGGSSVMVPVDDSLVKLLYKTSQWSVAKDTTQHYRRSIYLLAKRNLRLPMLEVFDQPALQTSCSRRESSTHAPQALELLNGKLSNELARAFAERLGDEAGADHGALVERAFVLAAGRKPTDGERVASIEFLQSHSLSEFALALFNLNAFLYVE